MAFLAGLEDEGGGRLVLSLTIVGGLGWTFFVRDYQKMRVYTFLNPRLDPKGAGYQKIQSEIAVGRGASWARASCRGARRSSGTFPRDRPTSSSRCSLRRRVSWG